MASGTFVSRLSPEVKILGIRYSPGMPRPSDLLPADRAPTTYERAQEACDELERAVLELRDAGGLEGLLDEIRRRLDALLAQIPPRQPE